MCIKSVGEYIKSVSEFCNPTREDQDLPLDFTPFFRGCSGNHSEETSEIEKEVVPGIYREINGKKYLEYEHEMIEELISMRPEQFSKCNSTIEKLVMMQHYGLPTRLLDITQNALVALYFACESMSKNNGNVYAFRVPNKDIKYSDSDTVSVIANLAYMNYTFNLTDVEWNKGKLLLKDEDLGKDDYKKVKKFIHQIKKEKPYFQCAIEEEHLNNYVVCVKPKWDNPRIMTQQGAFFLFGMDKYKKSQAVNFTKKNNLHIWFTKIQIQSESKKKILKELELLGINQSTIYPDLDKTAEYIKKKYSK